MKNKKYLGIDIGGTNSKYGIIDFDNNILAKKSVKTENNANAENFLNNISQFIDESLKIEPEICSIGIGFPGIVSNAGILTSASSLPNLKNVEISAIISQKYKIPVVIDNDANAAAIAEMHAGEGKKLNNFIYLTLGTGIGGAIIINRKIFRGVRGGAGEVGSFIIESKYFDKNLTKFHNGKLENLIGREGIIKIFKEIGQNYIENKAPIKAEFLELFNKNFDVSDISKAAESGNIIATEALSIVGHYLGLAITSIANLLDISDFIIGGGISQSNFLMEKTIGTAKANSLPSISEYLSIKRAKFLSDTGIVGAALLGKSKY
jgi:glucokinase